MDTDAQTRRELRFACTSCGACCNRSPEVALSEAAALSDMFVFRLMFRLYELPRSLADGDAGSSAVFFESKRLLAAFAARKYPARRRQNGKAIDYMRYLTISALTLDTGVGACTALSDGRCAIYARRPLACRTVPFHYSRPEASAESLLQSFVATPGYGCDTGADAPVVLEAGRIVDPETRRARGDALDIAARDRRWTDAILRRMKTSSSEYALPSLREIEADAQFGATTTSMQVAWRIAAEAGLIGVETYRMLIAAQAAAIDRELAEARCPSSARETLGEMRAEYRALLNG